MNYIIIPSTHTMTSGERTRAFSRGLYSLGRPNPAPDDVTEYMFGFVTHPTTGETAMECDLDTEVRIDQDADTSQLVALFGETEHVEEVARLASLIEANRGGSVTFAQLVPSFVTVRTRDELDADGWFPTPEGEEE